jgi:NAD(P)-dependent dehydrogenase (short-subunit alcohol dehydrogenase family)
MAEVLSIETGHFGVKVSLVQPGVVATDGKVLAARKDSPEDEVFFPFDVNW